MTNQQTLTLGRTARSGGSFAPLLAFFQTMARAAESRRQLAELDGRMLADIGLGRAEAVAEADRAPWDLSPRRHR